MNTRQLMDNLFKSGSELFGNQSAKQAKPVGGQNDSLSSFLSGKGGAALAGGALGFLLGNKKARKVGGKVAMYGGLAALGAIAYKAYGNWQQRQGDTLSNNLSNDLVKEPQTIDQLSGTQAEQHSKAMLRALIGAAKADGHIDNREHEIIAGEIAGLSDDALLQQWFDQELTKPVDPAEVASCASSAEMAAEMYLTSLLVIDEENYMERAYLQELARQLKLDAALVAELEQQASLSLRGA